MRYLLSLFFCCSFVIANAQEKDSSESFLRSHYLSLELGGNGIGPTFSYERIIGRRKPLFHLRTGLMLFPFRVGGDARSVGAVAEFSFLSGRERSFFEGGIGYTYLFLFDDYYRSENESLHLLVFRIGYRHYNQSGKNFFKFGWTPIFLLNPSTPQRIYDPKFIPFVFGAGFGIKL